MQNRFRIRRASGGCRFRCEECKGGCKDLIGITFRAAVKNRFLTSFQLRSLHEIHSTEDEKPITGTLPCRMQNPTPQTSPQSDPKLNTNTHSKAIRPRAKLPNTQSTRTCRQHSTNDFQFQHLRLGGDLPKAPWARFEWRRLAES